MWPNIIRPVAATVDAGGMAVNYGDIDGVFFDLEAMLRIQPTDHIEIFGGYRWIDVDGDGTADGQAYDADLSVRGWFVGGGFVF